MNPSVPFDYLSNQVLAIGLTLPRILAAFVILPLMTSETVPPLVRNSFAVSLAIVAYPIAAAAGPITSVPQVMWAMVILKEIFIGVALGFSFSTIFWAVGAAGNVMDVKVGSSMASVIDPISGFQTSPTGSFLSQLAAFLFMTTGAFTLFLDLLLSSYKIWPVMTMLPVLRPVGLSFFISQFNLFMTAVLVISAPALVVTSLADFALGLINRYAQQLNVFALALPIKAWLNTWVVFLALGAIVEVVTRKVFENRGLLVTLQKLFH